MASFDTLRVKTVCENKLEIDFRTKSKEYNGWVYLDGKKACRITVPKGRKPIPPKTHKSMAIQLKLEKDQFDRLIECTMSQNDYITHLRSKVPKP